MCRDVSDNNPRRRGVTDDVPDDVLLDVTSSPVAIFEVITGAIQDVLFGHNGEALTATIASMAAPRLIFGKAEYLLGGKSLDVGCSMDV